MAMPAMVADGRRDRGIGFHVKAAGRLRASVVAVANFCKAEAVANDPMQAIADR
jgi:hypothetical protein